MKKLLLLVLFLGFLSVYSEAVAEEYVFACKNSWQQEIEVEVSANSVDEARKFLKTDRQYRNDVSQCSFRRENMLAKPKAMPDKLEGAKVE